MAYVYKLIDLETGKWYIGSRTKLSVSPEELGVKYFTSSKIVKPLYKINPDRFNKEILFESLDVDLVFEYEMKLLGKLNARDNPNAYNMSNGNPDFNPVKAGKSIGTTDRMAKLGRTSGLQAKTNGNLVRAREISKENGFSPSAGGKAAAKSGVSYLNYLKSVEIGGFGTSEKSAIGAKNGAKNKRELAKQNYYQKLEEFGLPLTTKLTLSEAKTIGTKHYFGKVCSKHVELDGWRLASTRSCPGCTAQDIVKYREKLKHD